MISSWVAALWSGIAAAVTSTAVEILLWATLTGALPGILWRDARLAAAIVLGPAALTPSETFDAEVVLVATLVHFALSIVYATALALIVARLGIFSSLIAGAAFGLALYGINLYGFTEIFPWFTVARGGITLAAHLMFGLSASAAYCWLSRRQAETRQ